MITRGYTKTNKIMIGNRQIIHTWTIFNSMIANCSITSGCSNGKSPINGGSKRWENPHQMISFLDYQRVHQNNQNLVIQPRLGKWLSLAMGVSFNSRKRVRSVACVVKGHDCTGCNTSNQRFKDILWQNKFDKLCHDDIRTFNDCKDDSPPKANVWMTENKVIHQPQIR